MMASLRTLDDRRLIVALSLAGMLLALWIQFRQGGWVNSDATLYLEMARRFAAGDRAGALQLYNWPLFPWLVAQLHQLTGLGLENAARAVVVLAFGAATWGLLALIREAGGTRVTLVAGAWLLFTAPYIVDDVLPRIMRDQAFWACHLLSLVYFLRYYRDGHLSQALAWQGCALLAILFRVEAVSFALLLPLALLLQPNTSWRARWRHWAVAMLGPALVLVAAGIALLVLPAAEMQANLGRLSEMQSALIQSYQRITVGLPSMAQQYGQVVLGNPWAARYAGIGLLLTLLAIVAGSVIGAAGWLAVLLAAGRRRLAAPAMTPHARQVLGWAAGIHLLNLAVILLTVFLLTGRYAIGLAFIILVFAAFALDGLYRAWRERRRHAALLGLVALATLYGLADNLMQRDAADDVRMQAAAWVRQQAVAGARIFFEDAQMRYYAGAPWAGRENEWDGTPASVESDRASYDLLVVRVSHRHPEKRTQLLGLRHYQLAREFIAENGDRILVMQASARTAPVRPDAPGSP